MAAFLRLRKLRPPSTRKRAEGPVMRIAVMAVAVGLLLYALFPFLAGGWIVSQWAAVSTALLSLGFVMFLGAAATVGSALWLLVRLGRPRQPLWMGGIGSLLSGAALCSAALTHVYPCPGPD
jgi:hypothetical protein